MNTYPIEGSLESILISLDKPAKVKCSNLANFNSYESCMHCFEKGERDSTKNRIYFPMFKSTERTHEDFVQAWNDIEENEQFVPGMVIVHKGWYDHST